MELVVGQAGLDLVDCRNGLGRCKTVVLHHKLVGDGHDLAEHVGRLISEADVVAVALRHLLHTVGALEQRERQAHLRLHAELLHKLATGKQVEELIGAAELDVSLDNDGVVSLHDRIHELVKADW